MRIAALTEERNLGPSLEHPTGMARGNSSTTRSRHLGPISEAFFAHLASSEEGADGSPQSQLNYGSSLTELEPGRPPCFVISRGENTASTSFCWFAISCNLRSYASGKDGVASFRFRCKAGGLMVSYVVRL